MTRKAPSGPASRHNLGEKRKGRDGKMWEVIKGKTRGKYWHHKLKKHLRRARKKVKYPHVFNRFRRSPYQRNLTNWMLMQDNLDAKVFYHNGGYIFAYCDRTLPICYVVSNTLRLTPLKPDVTPLPTPRNGPTNEERLNWREYGQLQSQVTPGLMEEVFKKFSAYDTGRIFMFAMKGTHINGMRVYLNEVLKIAKKKPVTVAFAFPIDRVEAATVPLSERWKYLLKDLRGDKALVFNLMLVAEGLRPGMLVDLNRYMHEPSKIERIRKLVGAFSTIALLDNPIKKFILIYNQDLVNYEDAVNACSNEALRGAILGFFCPGSFPAEWCVTYCLNNTIFYVEPCCGQAKWEDMLKRGKRWSHFAESVMGGSVTMSVNPLMQEPRTLQLMKSRNAEDIFTYKNEIAYHFFEHHFEYAAETLTGVDCRVIQSPCMPIWTMVSVLIQKEYNPFLVLDNPTEIQFQNIVLAIKNLEDQMFDLIESSHEEQYIVGYVDLLEHWGFYMTASIVNDSRFGFQFPGKQLEFSLIVELVIAIDKLAQSKGFEFSDNEIKSKVRLLDKELLTALRTHL